jgi:hypothetical protein
MATNASTTSCSSWACWPDQQKAATSLTIVAFVIAILGLIIWGFGCQMKYRRERRRDTEAGNERNGGWPGLAAPGVAGLYELQALPERRRRREMSPDRSYWSSSSSERETRRPRRARLAGAIRGRSGLGEGVTPRTSSMLSELGGYISQF